MNLTPDQLAAIDRHLRKENWLLNEDLIAELTDHYAAGLEDRMANGTIFDAALREVHTSFGGRKGLLKMEEGHQVQRSRRLMLDERREVKTFFSGKRRAVTLGVFALLYILNTSGTYRDVVSSFMNFSEFAVLSSLAGMVFAGAIHNWVWYDRRVTDKPFAVPALTPFVKIFGLCYVSAGALAGFTTAHSSGTLWPVLHLLAITFTQTLSFTCVMGIFIAVRKVFVKKTKPA